MESEVYSLTVKQLKVKLRSLGLSLSGNNHQKINTIYNI